MGELRGHRRRHRVGVRPKQGLVGWLIPIIDILQALDVVLADVVSGLHLDDPQGRIARVLKAVNGAQGNKGRLVRAQIEHLVVPGDACRAVDDDPVLGAMVVALQAQSSPRLDDNLLDQKSLPFIQVLVMPPGPVDAKSGFWAQANAGPVVRRADKLDALVFEGVLDGIKYPGVS